MSFLFAQIFFSEFTRLICKRLDYSELHNKVPNVLHRISVL
ncbi:hypothetical protein LEP1GSC151_3706 [Leptospira interrogans serovar Grippotyphosa str. LT2186]|uniref:Uncharacterized protein n=3 Tax=Leptospira interrogans TaxID=173 RepID=M3IAP4_LEPIR|nr:hypothetical protein LEP1GSC027_4137 [Leptospira interrogans str. 2002000624]EKO89533.1 hypothetical protein LEP1GSC009_4842 [Leptospira interrogans serovar Grippotyphosa str. Andaman]EKP85069.1 hypothetical protein LEP1GSC020_0611 [Leptospira interrogans serovar Grippotyphosa str. 2006006986]EKQ39913.1 hypothetical protein LEP1GSC025_1025 [Leptospira interrogans str. 2002000621]EKQ45315.1 hypothetical protein LEP1GSC026_0141 [Leptospira interrogans str. 2002000623]EKR28535.1 hypothetical p